MRSRGVDEEHLLTFYAFPAVMHRYIRSTNAIESLFSNVRQRADQIDAFTTAHGFVSALAGKSTYAGSCGAEQVTST